MTKEPEALHPPIVHILWRDSAMSFDEITVGDISHVCHMQTTGFVIAEDPNEITIARDLNGPSVTPGATYRGVITIPKFAIISTTKLATPPAKEETCEE